MDKPEFSYEITSGMNKERFEQLFKIFYPRLKRYACNLLKNEAEAEDLVQDVFVYFWQNSSELRDQNKVGCYLFTLTRNRCLNLIKHKIVQKNYTLNSAAQESEELYQISFEDCEDFIPFENKLKSELEKIVSEMPEKCRTAFRLRWFEGKKIREIAEIMKISTTMVDKHLANGLEKARQNLNPDNITDVF